MSWSIDLSLEISVSVQVAVTCDLIIQIEIFWIFLVRKFSALSNEHTVYKKI